MTLPRISAFVWNKFFKRRLKGPHPRGERNLPRASLLIWVSDQSKCSRTIDIEVLQPLMLSDQRVDTKFVNLPQRYLSKPQKQLFYYCVPGGVVRLITS